ncbi:hypothetical protein ACQPZZ_21235 [Microbispora sp. CA-135349]|uniref:hypothetical protein n=1 Tax=Microbispora sp. CA-135349 TaxID=3239953 RepID=UPI003D915DEF
MTRRKSSLWRNRRCEAESWPSSRFGRVDERFDRIEQEQASMKAAQAQMLEILIDIQRRVS